MFNDDLERTPSGLIFYPANEHGEEFVFFDDLKANWKELSPKGRDFLELLADRPLGRCVPTGEMDDALWPDEPVESNNRSKIASEIRRWLLHSELGQRLKLPRGGTNDGYAIVKRKVPFAQDC